MKTYIILVSLLLLLAFAICVSCVEVEKGEVEVNDYATNYFKQARTNAIKTYVEAKNDWLNGFERGEELSLEDTIEVMRFMWQSNPFEVMSGYDRMMEHIRIRRTIERLCQYGFVISKKRE